MAKFPVSPWLPIFQRFDRWNPTCRFIFVTPINFTTFLAWKIHDFSWLQSMKSPFFTGKTREITMFLWGFHGIVRRPGAGRCAEAFLGTGGGENGQGARFLSWDHHLVGDWNMAGWWLSRNSWEYIIIIPTDDSSIIFQRGRLKPPTSVILGSWMKIADLMEISEDKWWFWIGHPL